MSYGQPQGFEPHLPGTWRQADQTALGITRSILERGGHIRQVKPGLFEAVLAGDWTKYESQALTATVHDYLLETGAIAPDLTRPNRRWIATPSGRTAPAGQPRAGP